jgi:TDG/mug DNA glycosylase family protein
VLASGLIAVICGTAAGTVAARRGIPYSGPGNTLWPTLRATGLVPPDFDMARFRDLPRFGLGMTDVVKTAFGADHEIAEAAYDVARFRARMVALRPRAIGFDGLNAARRFYDRRDVASGRQPDWEGIAIFVLPSTSGRARRFWDERPWRAFAAFVRALRTAP